MRTNFLVQVESFSKAFPEGSIRFCSKWPKRSTRWPAHGFCEGFSKENIQFCFKNTMRTVVLTLSFKSYLNSKRPIPKQFLMKLQKQTQRKRCVLLTRKRLVCSFRPDFQVQTGSPDLTGGRPDPAQSRPGVTWSAQSRPDHHRPLAKLFITAWTNIFAAPG